MVVRAQHRSAATRGLRLRAALASPAAAAARRHRSAHRGRACRRVGAFHLTVPTGAREKHAVARSGDQPRHAGVLEGRPSCRGARSGPDTDGRRLAGAPAPETWPPLPDRWDDARWSGQYGTPRPARGHRTRVGQHHEPVTGPRAISAYVVPHRLLEHGPSALTRWPPMIGNLDHAVAGR